MAIKFTVSFPIFAPPLQSNPHQNPNAKPPSSRPLTEIRFARWGNANAEKFERRRRAQQEIEDDIRRYRRFDAATKIAIISDSDSAAAISQTENFKSLGTRSSPSAPSIPGKKSKYSKPPDFHPAFRKISKAENRQRDQPVDKKAADVKIAEDGVSYVIDGAPFEFKYSYTETPKVKPLKLREPPFTPFGPVTMPRPWTGRAPLPPSKKKLKEFDSFVLPPPNKKGVKPVQKPGPFLPGTGPRYVKSREEILGEPLTEQEIKEMIASCNKSKRQLNMGRDGLIHNMLDNIHAHWKRRRVCKIKCKGVCTVDMDNVCKQLEERTGGKIIYRKGGVLYLFRGRNYNYKTRPRFPLMLWKPVTPVYPRLIQRAPEGLTLEEATEMRMKGRKLIPICKLAKNGVYCDLVKNVREAFEECQLARINCQGIKGSDYRKIGAKLKDLVPCVLISFEGEHILMWRGQNWRSTHGKSEANLVQPKETNKDAATSITAQLEGQEVSLPSLPVLKDPDVITSHSQVSSQIVHIDQRKDSHIVKEDSPDAAINEISSATEIDGTSDNIHCNDDESENIGYVRMGNIRLDNTNLPGVHSEAVSRSYKFEKTLDGTSFANKESAAISRRTEIISRSPKSTESQLESYDLESSTNQNGLDASESEHDIQRSTRAHVHCTERVIFLLKQAIESGSAVVLDNASLDADRVYEQAVALAQSAPPGPVFTHRPPKLAIQNHEKKEHKTELKNMEKVQKNRASAEQASKSFIPEVIDERYLDVVPKGTLKVYELAKLLA